MQKIVVKDGKTYPLGATFDGAGTNFALFSANAQKVELCLFDSKGTKETARFLIEENDHNIWHVYLEGVMPGQLYGYRVDGPYKPLEGKRFNKNKLLIDPYAKKLFGPLIWHKAIFGYDVDSEEKDLSFSTSDSAPYVPKCVVTDDRFDFEDDVRPDTPFEESIIYEMHVKGYTALHPQLKDNCRGKFAGLYNAEIRRYLKELGITAVELLPVHAFYPHKEGKDSVNYWGYETLSFFALENSYFKTENINEFKKMVAALHKNGQEVLLDVVYNHTAEGNHLGPTLSFRGIDNETYYALDKTNKRYYFDSTGCGALFNVQNSNVLTLVMDSMRYFVQKMHVDGFRLDLAASLSREKNIFKYDSAFLSALKQDEVLRQVKLIAEPWDVGMGGYQIGAFPPGMAEWNDRFRDVVRQFWRGDERQVGEFASRLAGSSDIFGYKNKNLWSSVNFITAHDGFCLRDLVSFNKKHNEANNEANRDGTDHNRSYNSGYEGYVVSEAVAENRLKRARALMATMLLSFGTPMISAGDEFLKSQFGNNNPYCQDNVLNFIVWEAIDQEDENFKAFVKKLIEVRKSLKIFKRKHFFKGSPEGKSAFKDLSWFDENGKEFTDEDWKDAGKKAISYLAFDGTDFVWTIFNANNKKVLWKFPNIKKFSNRQLLADSSFELDEENLKNAKTVEIPSWSVVMFKISRSK